MLLLYQVGSVKIGEVVRYTVTYTPSRDRILPAPEALHLRIRNTSSTALRAAFVHGPYTLSVAAYPSTFRPDERFAQPRRYGVPEFEPMLKAGGTWSCRLVVPDDIRPSAGAGLGAGRGHFGGVAPGQDGEGEGVTWIIEVASQVIFSASAAVGYEILLARDEKSLNLSSVVPVIGNQAQVPQPGRVSDYERSLRARPPAPGGEGRPGAGAAALLGAAAPQPKGVFSRAVHLKIEDTASLWNTPLLPGWDEDRRLQAKEHGVEVPFDPVGSGEHVDQLKPPTRTKKVHLVVLTHGLHGNLGGDMLFLKESIDAGVKQAKIDATARRARERAEKESKDGNLSAGTAVKSASGPVYIEREGKGDDDDDDDEDVETVVRGFSGNATRTERGIKYLGKRLARYVLSMTYPDQPFMPAAKAASEVAHALKGAAAHRDAEGKPVHKHSTIHKAPAGGAPRLYKITKISFIAHSLGGLVQTYAVAYIQKHSPQFFDLIEPINFIAMATPFLGLNHENPLYVKFGLDFGLVGRTGQDLGLTWRAPTLARSGWGALVSNLGENAHKHVLGEAQPESKPLLRILPTGPAHTALKKFRNRTVYSNVVNDGIVPLRTSCLLFLDWQGLGRVDKARREVGLVETVVGFGWAELTGANVTSPREKPWAPEIGEKEESDMTQDPPPDDGDSHAVPQPSTNATLEDDRQSLRSLVTTPNQDGGEGPPPSQDSHYSSTTNNNINNPFTGFFNLFKGSDAPKSPSATPPSHKQNKIYQRSQTLRVEDSSVATSATSASSSRSRVTTGYEPSDEGEGLSAPPRTSFFESAADLMNPKLPSVEYLIDPTKRPRTIFHDRIYHPSDIPPLPLKKRPTGSLAMRRRSYHRTPSSSGPSGGGGGANSTSSSPFPSPRILHEDSALSQRDYDDTAHTNPGRDAAREAIDSASLKVEEKIARAYHRDLSWRKVLVKLEPDAHNNMIVRRMFANAFGWPVVKHLVDAHFSDSAAARTRDDEESGAERARNPAEPPDEHGGETRGDDGEGKEAQKSKDSLVESTVDSAAEERGAVASAVAGKEDQQQQQQVEGAKKGEEAKETEFEPRPLVHTSSELREAQDAVPDLPAMQTKPGTDGAEHSASRPTMPDRVESATWSERHWADSADETDGEEEEEKSDAHDVAYPGAAGEKTEEVAAEGGGVDEKKSGGQGEVSEALS